MSETNKTEISKIAIAGAGGLLGTRLCELLKECGYHLFRLVRPGSSATHGADSIPWDPRQGMLDPNHLAGMDAVIHLGGENLASGRWTRARKRRIVGSRLRSTTLLSRALAAMTSPPRVFLCASAVGFYGNRGEELLDETAAAGEGFLADLALAWEASAVPAKDAGIRVVHCRIGVVLAEQGGALAKMLPVFRLGLGGRAGKGRQYMSWIAIEDVVRAILFCLENNGITGPVNMVAPNPVTNAEFAGKLGRVLRRPSILPLPAAAVHALLGEMGQELLLKGARVSPARLLESGFQFRYPRLEPALRAILEIEPPSKS